MKVNWSTVRLTLLCLILFPSLLNAGQDSAAKQKNTRPTQKPQTRPATAQTGKRQTAAPTTGKGQTASRTPPSNTSEPKGTDTPNGNGNTSSNTSSNTSTDQRKTDAPAGLAQSKQDLKDRIEATLNDAKTAVDDADDQELQRKLKQLTSEGDSLKQEVDNLANQQDLIVLESRFVELKASSDAIIAAAPSWTDNLTFNNILSFLALLLSLASLACVVFLFLTFKKALLVIAEWQDSSNRAERELKQSVKDNKERVETVEANLSRVAADLGLKIDSAKRSSEEAKKLAAARESPNHNPEPLRAEPAFEVLAEPSFPSLVADYLNRLRRDQPTAVEADFRTNRLVAAAAESAPFFFIEDADGSGAGIVLPKPRLQRSQEFSAYYKGYYYCSDPSAGEVYIIEPAVVSPDGNGWRLSQMGRMEIH